MVRLNAFGRHKSSVSKKILVRKILLLAYNMVAVRDVACIGRFILQTTSRYSPFSITLSTSQVVMRARN